MQRILRWSTIALVAGCGAGEHGGAWSGDCSLIDPYAYTGDEAYTIGFELDLVQRGDRIEGTGTGNWGDTDYDGTVTGDARGDKLAFDLRSEQTNEFSSYGVVFGFDAQARGDRMTGACGVTSEGTGALDGDLVLTR